MMDLKIRKILFLYVFVGVTDSVASSAPQDRLEQCMNVTADWLDCSDLSLDYMIAYQWTRQLNVSYNNIGDGSLNIRSVAFWRNLQRIDLSHNHIRIFIGRGTTLPRLTHLNISHNKIFDLKPRMFMNMDKLIVLNIAFNKISMISHSALRLPRLKRLNLSHNRLTTLRLHYFRGIHSLEELELSFNLITSIPSMIFVNIRNLSNIDLSHNRISKVSRYAFVNVTSLELFDLKFNSFTQSLTQCFRSPVKVRRIVLSFNDFGNFFKGYVANLSVRRIDLNYIKDLIYISDESFVSLPLLEEIHIENNRRLQFISARAFERLENLLALFLANNNLFTISERLPLAQPHLSYLDIRNNPFYCDCSLMWFKNFSYSNETSSYPIFNTFDVTCIDKNNSKLPVEDLTLNDTECAPHMQILKTDEDSIVDLSSNISINCVSSGLKQPNISWYNANSSSGLIDQCPGRICQSDGYLWLHSAREEDAGYYRCIAENQNGEQEMVVRIEVISPNLTLKTAQVSSTFILLHWSSQTRELHMNTCVFIYKNIEVDKEHRSVLRNCNHQKFYTLVDLTPESEYNISIYKLYRNHLFKMDSISVRTGSESMIELLAAHYKFWVLCSIVIVLIISPIIISCAVQLTKHCCQDKRKYHSEMSMFIESDSGTCFVLDTDDTSLSGSYLNQPDDCQLIN